MPTRRVIRGVLDGFLSTFTSRYSDYRDYWLLGQLEPHLPHWRADLLNPPSEPETVVDVAAWLAARRFAEQLAKYGLPPSMVVQASVESSVSAGPTSDWAGTTVRPGHVFEFLARAVLDTGSCHERRRSVFVAPHDPKREHRSVREGRGT